jgi:hypothetical protein
MSMDADLEAMLVRLLRPLVGALMRRGVGYIALRDLLKRVYVEEALSQHETPGAATDSTISLVTGINRREVKALREALALEVPVETRERATGMSMAARAVATWASAAAFREADGTPRPLQLPDDEHGPGFDALLRLAKVDVRAKTVQEELIRAGVAERMADGRLRLLRAAFTPETPHGMMLFLADNVGDHLRAALHNLEGGAPRFIERALFHNRLTAAQLEAVRPQLTEMAAGLLRDANAALLAAPAEGETTNQRRLRLGVYYYEAKADDPA